MNNSRTILDGIVMCVVYNAVAGMFFFVLSRLHVKDKGLIRGAENHPDWKGWQKLAVPEQGRCWMSRSEKGIIQKRTYCRASGSKSLILADAFVFGGMRMNLRTGCSRNQFAL